MEEEFWKYWKQRWPNATQDEKVLQVSANYKETRAAFEAGFLAAQQTLAEDLPMCGVCGESVVYKDELCFECHSLKSASH